MEILRRTVEVVERYIPLAVVLVRVEDRAADARPFVVAQRSSLRLVAAVAADSKQARGARAEQEVVLMV